MGMIFYILGIFDILSKGNSFFIYITNGAHKISYSQEYYYIII